MIANISMHLFSKWYAYNYIKIVIFISDRNERNRLKYCSQVTGAEELWVICYFKYFIIPNFSVISMYFVIEKYGILSLERKNIFRFIEM